MNPQGHFPPFTKPEAAYDSARLYRETSEIAAAQDAKLDGKPDPVNAPTHYALGNGEAIDVIEAVAATVTDPVEAVLTSHALKYLLRWPRKGGSVDLLKCRWYLARLIDHVDKAERSAALADLANEAQAWGMYSPPFEGNPDDCALPPNLSAACRHPMAAEADRIADATVSAERAYACGWRRAALWALRYDLLSDVGSPAFDRDMTRDLSATSPEDRL